MKVASTGTKPSNLPTNPFDRPDTLRSGAGGTGAPLETLGTSPAFRGPAVAATPIPTGPHVRRGVLGIHPLALLAGLIALHIFIVTTVIK